MPVLGIRIRMCWVRINYQLFGFCNETESFKSFIAVSEEEIQCAAI